MDDSYFIYDNLKLMALSLISLSLITFRTLDSVICKRWFEDILYKRVPSVDHLQQNHFLFAFFSLLFFFIFLMKLEKRKVQERSNFID